MSGSTSKILALLIVFAAANSASAQVPVRLQEAIDSSVKNNLVLRSDLLQTQYQQHLKKMSYAMPATNLFVENGQINSFYIDQRLGVSQSFSFPTVYKRSKDWYEDQFKLSELKFQLSEIELKRQVRQCFYQILYLKEKEELLKRNDSFLAAFVKKTQLKYQLGDINVLEKTGAENQRNRLAIQLQQLQNDKQLLLYRLQLLLNSSAEIRPAADSLKYKLPSLDSSYLSQHPQIRQMWQNYQSSLSKLSLEKSKLMPDISLSYANMSMKGTGADNRFYSGSTRFQSFQIGVGVPVFSGAQRAQIKATQTESEITKNNYQAQLQSFSFQWQSAIQQHQHYTSVLGYYEKGGLENARKMRDAADQQLSAGEINYLDWVIIIGQYIGIESEYLDAVNNYNDNIIQMEYLMGK
ncbi:MAG: TolC family protein [Chitinophagaceae bacterium]